MHKVYLDANILLEVLFSRVRRQKVLNLLENLQDAQFCVSVLSVDLVMYFVELEKKPRGTAQEFLKRYETLDMTAQDAQWAFDNDNGDFEDALQVACARRHGCTTFITLDQGVEPMHSKHIPVQTIR